MQKLNIERFIDSFKLEPVHILFLIVSPVVAFFMSSKVAELVYEKFLMEEIKSIQTYDITSIQKLEMLTKRERVSEVNLDLSVKSLGIKHIPLSQNQQDKIQGIPSLSSILEKPVGPTLNLELQAVFVSDDNKESFVIIGGKIYREGSKDDKLKIMKIMPNKVLVENIATGDKIWLEL